MSTAQRNRELMPNVAALIDEFRAANPGIDFKVVHAIDEQTGVEIGKPFNEPNVFTIPKDYFPQPRQETPRERKSRSKTR